MANTATTHTVGVKPYPLEQVRDWAREAHRKSDLRATTLPAAVAVECDPQTGVTITMQDGCRVIIPLTVFHELQGATDAEVRDLVMIVDGYVMEWRQLDLQFGIPELVTELFGYRFLLAEHLKAQARQAGQATSEIKSAAARANGAKGGRPKKSAKAAP